MTKNLINKKVGFISLGCDKNRVDLEKLIFRVASSGFSIVNDIAEANIVIINTCSFIKIAREESINNILDCANYKKNQLEKIIVTGCINEMNYSDLASSMPEVDAFVNIKDNNKIVKTIYKLYNINVEYADSDVLDRVLTTAHYSYLKIADGCNNFCSYCTIPFIRGRYLSVSINNLLTEATNLVNKGVSELILVAQDVTKYGSDFKDGTNLVTLISALSQIDKLKKIRLLYCYPESITGELIKEIKENDKVCKYIDMPIQHISDNILSKMNRRGTSKLIKNVINSLRKSVPNIAIRSTFILGFPGETEKDFAILCDFIKEYKLDNVGFFTYSRESGTRAYDYKPQIAQNIKNKRLKEISKIQQQVVFDNNKKLIGKTLQVVIENITPTHIIGRADFQCPIVDGIVIIKKAENIIIGNYYSIIITDILNYDIKGEIIK